MNVAISRKICDGYAVPETEMKKKTVKLQYAMQYDVIYGWSGTLYARGDAIAMLCEE